MNIFIGIIIFILLFVFIVAMSYWKRSSDYYKKDMKAVWAKGYQEKQVTLEDGSIFNYAEGENNGKPLLLIHGQGQDWTSYAKNLPALSKHYHVYAIDCYGHGKSSHSKEKYNANGLGKDLQWFIKNVVKEPVVISGHSSGGLIAAWLGANAPDAVVGLFLEDPPFFSCEDDRKKQTYNYQDLSTICHHFLQQSEETDFPLYYFEHQKVWDYFSKKAKNRLVKYGRKFRRRNPDSPLIIGYLPPSMTSVFKAMNFYDAKFGETFFDGSFMKNFSHEETLEKIQCPTLLIHASWKYDKEGVLEGAMTEDDANRVQSLVKKCTLEKVDCLHSVHDAKPELFNGLLWEHFGK